MTARLRPSVRRPLSEDAPGPQEAATGTPGAFPVTFEVEGKPVSTNQTYRTGRGRWFKDPAAAAWQARVTLMAKRAMRGLPPYSGEV